MSEEQTPAEAPAEDTPVERASALYYIGETDPVTGEPIQYVLGVPSRDLDEAAIAQLSDAEYVTAVDAGIFTTTKPKQSKAKTAPAPEPEPEAPPAPAEGGGR
jgi:hypothetical protein